MQYRAITSTDSGDPAPKSPDTFCKSDVQRLVLKLRCCNGRQRKSLQRKNNTTNLSSILKSVSQTAIPLSNATRGHAIIVECDSLSASVINDLAAVNINRIIWMFGNNSDNNIVRLFWIHLRSSVSKFMHSANCIH